MGSGRDYPTREIAGFAPEIGSPVPRAGYAEIRLDAR